MRGSTPLTLWSTAALRIKFDIGSSHSFGGEYRELTPHECTRYTAKFDAPNLSGEI